MAEQIDGSLVFGPPKSAAGTRLVSILARILPDITVHLDRSGARRPASCALTGRRGAATFS